MCSPLYYLPLILLTLSIFLPSSLQDYTIEFPIITSGTSASQQYVVPVALGDPPQTLNLILDTGSDMTWVYCGSGGNSDESVARHRGVFDHSSSTSFMPVAYDSTRCMPTQQCTDVCPYTVDYVDGTSTSGYLVHETLTVGSSDKSSIEVPDMVIGCSGHGSTNLTDADGILGLAWSPLSFSFHLGSRFGASFSYSLSQDSGLLVFGSKSGRRASEEMQYVELVLADQYFYRVEVSGLWIEDERLDVPGWVWKYDPQTGSGGVVLDTGTTFTHVPEAAFQAISAWFADFLGFYDSGRMTSSEICFNLSDAGSRGNRLPSFSIEFEGGVWFVPEEDGLFYDDGEGGKCLAILPIDRSVGSIIGSRLQMGYFWDYDLLNRRVGFAPLSH